jgi:hypothetical protein
MATLGLEENLGRTPEDRNKEKSTYGKTTNCVKTNKKIV